MNQDLIIIKKKYGEKMMHLCRSLFPILLEVPGMLSDLILSHFEPTRFLYDDIIKNDKVEEFKDYIYSLVVQKVIKKEKNTIEKTPYELLEEAGYILYECKTEQDIQSFRKYYKPAEELCTFEGGRLKRCYVFFAIKKNVSKIKRENFPNPSRQDEYGTSVISIQFTKGKVNTLSIKNRYNHRVVNPDATFGNNLDNIIPGLTESFIREYHLNLEQEGNDFELPGYVKANDGKYYKYNMEINNIYYCPGNIIIDNFKVITKYKDEPERYIVLDYFILDLKKRTIKLYDENIDDLSFEDIKNIEKITVTKDKNTGNKIIELFCQSKPVIKIVINKSNQIIEYHDKTLVKVGNDFLSYNQKITVLELPNLVEVGDSFLFSNTSITNLSLPRLVKIGDCFLVENEKLTSLYLPNIIEIGSFFLGSNTKLTTLNLPNLVKVENSFMSENEILRELSLPNLRQVGNSFLFYNDFLVTLYLPNLIKTGDCFFRLNNSLIEIDLPKLREAGSIFLPRNKSAIKVNLPNLEQVGYDFFKTHPQSDDFLNSLKISKPKLKRRIKL